MRLRVQVQATDDPASAAYVLRYQKNGSGGYVAVPVGASVAEAYGTVTFQSIGTGANGSTTVAPSYPASIAAGDYLVAIVTSGSTGDATPTDSGSKWTLLATGASSDGSYGVDTGPRRVTAFGCIADGTESGTYTFNISSGGTCRGTISRFTKAGSGSWDIEAEGADDSTSGTDVSMTFATMNWNTGDAVLVATGQRVDSATQSAQSLSASGVTFGTRTNRAATAVTTGNDHRHSVDTFAAISSTSDVDAAATWSYTASAAASAGGVVVRLREYTAPVTNEIYVATSANITDGGATTQQLSTGSGTFDAGQIVDASNSITLDIGNNRYTELEWNLATQSPAVDTDYFDFRVYAAGAALDTYTDTPRWTIGGGATNVALSGQSVTVSAGTLAHTHSVALGGQAVTASAGTLTGAATYTAALSGQAATASAGTIGVTTTRDLAGQAATASAGTLTPSLSLALTGSAVTAAAGTLTPSLATTVALDGSAVTASAGTLGVTHSNALSGQAATSSAGTLTPALSVALTGSAVTASAGTLTPTQDTVVGLTGQSVTAAAGTLGVTSAVALAGSAVTASAGTLTAAATYTAALSGQAVTTSAGTLAASTSIALTGQAVSVSAGTLTPDVQGDVTIALTGEGVTVSTGTLAASGGEVSGTRGAGRKRKRRRYVVEIDGQTFDVGSPEEAVALLNQAATLASKAAEEAAQAVVKARLPRVRRLGKVAPVALSARIKTDVPATPELARAKSAIQAIYDEAAQRAEMQLLLERQAADEDEQDIEDLIAIGAL